MGTIEAIRAYKAKHGCTTGEAYRALGKPGWKRVGDRRVKIEPKEGAR